MTTLPPIEWRMSDGLTDYEDAVGEMERRATDIQAGRAPELIWFLEHPPLYTAGTTAQESDLLEARFPVYQSRRGGQYTYHGPGQRVVYVMLNLKARGMAVRQFVANMEAWVIAALAEFNVKGETREGRVGIWVQRGSKEDKVGAIGVRVRHGITFHGLSVNVEPDLSHFTGIVPCGIREHGVTSLIDLGLPVTMADLDVALKATFEEVFFPQTVGN
jgi:lipoyl(octanoyl) transferase